MQTLNKDWDENDWDLYGDEDDFDLTTPALKKMESTAYGAFGLQKVH